MEFKEFKIEDLEKYRGTEASSIIFENNYFFFNNILGYILAWKNGIKYLKLAHSKDWESFKTQVEEVFKKNVEN